MASNRLKNLTKEIWWLVLLTGIAGILFGLITIIWPGLTLEIFLYVVAFFVILVGAISVVRAFANIKVDPLWWLTLLFGVLGIAIGIYLLCNPAVAFTIFVILLAVYVFAQSLLDLVIASYAGKNDSKWLWILTGVLGIIFGIVVLFFPESASVAFILVLGIYALIHGAIAIAFAISSHGTVKKLTKKTKKKK